MLEFLIYKLPFPVLVGNLLLTFSRLGLCCRVKSLLIKFA